jgi:hypothetical protein
MTPQKDDAMAQIFGGRDAQRHNGLANRFVAGSPVGYGGGYEPKNARLSAYLDAWLDAADQAATAQRLAKKKVYKMPSVKLKKTDLPLVSSSELKLAGVKPPPAPPLEPRPVAGPWYDYEGGEAGAERKAKAKALAKQKAEEARRVAQEKKEREEAEAAAAEAERARVAALPAEPGVEVVAGNEEGTVVVGLVSAAGSDKKGGKGVSSEYEYEEEEEEVGVVVEEEEGVEEAAPRRRSSRRRGGARRPRGASAWAAAQEAVAAMTGGGDQAKAGSRLVPAEMWEGVAADEAEGEEEVGAVVVAGGEGEGDDDEEAEAWAAAWAEALGGEEANAAAPPAPAAPAPEAPAAPLQAPSSSMSKPGVMVAVARPAAKAQQQQRPPLPMMVVAPAATAARPAAQAAPSAHAAPVLPSMRPVGVVAKAPAAVGTMARVAPAAPAAPAQQQQQQQRRRHLASFDADAAMTTPLFETLVATVATELQQQADPVLLPERGQAAAATTTPGTPSPPGGFEAELDRNAAQAQAQVGSARPAPRVVRATGADALSAARDGTGGQPTTGAAAAVGGAEGGAVWAVVGGNSMLRVLKLSSEEGQKQLTMPAVPLSSSSSSSPSSPSLAVPLSAFFQQALPESYRAASISVSDPVVLFDRERRRFVVVAVARDARREEGQPLEPLLLVAVSAEDGAAPDAGGWVAAALSPSSSSCASSLRPELYHPQASVDAHGVYVTVVRLCVAPAGEEGAAADPAAAAESDGPLLLAIPKRALYSGTGRLSVPGWTGGDLYAAVSPYAEAGRGDFAPGVLSSSSLRRR